jgi:hypothetical protein
MAIKKFGEWCQQFNENVPISASAAITDYKAKAKELGTAGTGGLNILMTAFEGLDATKLASIVKKMIPFVDDPDIKGRIMTALNRYLKSRPTDESPE